MSQCLDLENAYGLERKYLDEMGASERFYCDILYKISTEIFENRLDLGMSQSEFAEMLGVSQAMISKYESGEYNFSVKQICKICEKLDLVPKFELTSKAERNAETQN